MIRFANGAIPCNNGGKGLLMGQYHEIMEETNLLMGQYHVIMEEKAC